MKSKVNLLSLLLFLFSACGTSVDEPVEQVQRTQTLIAIIAPTPSPRPTSTLDEYNQEAKDQYGGIRFCQVWPESARFGSTINVSAFGLPANDTVSIYVFPHQASTNTFMTDSNGYVNADITIPMNADPEWNIVVVVGTDVSVECFVWLWSEEYLPTYYAGLTKTLTPTLSPDQVVMTATQQALKDRLGANCTYGSARGIRLSPNGQWAEANCGPDSIIIIRMDETKEWSLSSDSLIGPYTDHFTGVDHWSKDGAYAYVGVNPHTDGYWEPFHEATDLFRLNLETGQISEVLKGGYYSFTFSPDDSMLAYIETDQSPIILTLRDLQTGAEQTFKFESKYNTGGSYVWSPDSKKLVFSIVQYDENNFKYVASSIVLWEREKQDVTVLIKDYQFPLTPIEWVEETKIMLQVLYEDDTKFEFDLKSGELKQINP